MNFMLGASPIWSIASLNLGFSRFCTLYFLSLQKAKPHDKKVLIFQYSKGSNAYIFLGENDVGTSIKQESCSANFLKLKFSSIGETSKDIEFIEVKDKLAPIEEGVDPPNQ